MCKNLLVLTYSGLDLSEQIRIILGLGWWASVICPQGVDLVKCSLQFYEFYALVRIFELPRLICFWVCATKIFFKNNTKKGILHHPDYRFYRKNIILEEIVHEETSKGYNVHIFGRKTPLIICWTNILPKSKDILQCEVKVNFDT